MREACFRQQARELRRRTRRDRPDGPGAAAHRQADQYRYQHRGEQYPNTDHERADRLSTTLVPLPSTTISAPSACTVVGAMPKGR